MSFSSFFTLKKLNKIKYNKGGITQQYKQCCLVGKQVNANWTMKTPRLSSVLLYTNCKSLQSLWKAQHGITLTCAQLVFKITVTILYREMNANTFFEVWPWNKWEILVWSRCELQNMKTCMSPVVTAQQYYIYLEYLMLRAAGCAGCWMA